MRPYTPTTHPKDHAVSHSRPFSTPTSGNVSDSPAALTGTASRRDLLRWTGAAALVAGAGGLFTGTAEAATAAATTFSPLRPPATPLAVRSPYLSTWQASDTLTGTWSSFWNGRTTAFCGIARIDGVAYLFAGAPTSSVVPNTMAQTSLQLTATRSIYTFNSAGITLTVTFFSPVDLGDLQRQCVPFSYVTAKAASSDGNSHTVSVYLDISAEWAHGDNSQLVSWAAQQTGGGNMALTFTPNSPTTLAESGDQASWGTVALVSPNLSGLTWQIGADAAVRGAMVSQGTLNGTAETGPRAISNNWPVLGFSRNLGTVTPAAPSALFQVSVGHVRTPAVSYLGTSLNAWWSNYWGSWQAMADWFLSDYAAALSSASALDAQIQSAASAAVGGGTVGSDYAAICALALRQAVGGSELVDRGGAPWAFVKEISSDGNVSTVDVIYPAFPAYLYLSPTYLQHLLEPVLSYAESGLYPETYCPHDLGSSYPNAAGHNNGGDEAMPIEESANMLIMTAAMLQRLPAASAAAFAQAHYPILRQWAQYLVANTLDPANQNQTDDFTGFIAHSVNLALKGMIGVGAMSIVAGFAGNSADQASYMSTARGYLSQWVSKGEDPSGSYLDLAYGDTSTWSLKYNGFSDRLLGLDLVPVGITAQEASWYQSNAGAYGVILDPRNNYTKADWELWTAAWLADQTTTRNTLIQGVYNYANTSPQRVPFGDWYVVATGVQLVFRARPVVGGAYGLLLSPGPSGTSWARIQNYNSGKLLAVSGMSLADGANVTQWSDNGTVDHVWTVVHNADGTVRIFNRNSGKLLAVAGASTADGAFVTQWYDNGTSDHLWRFVDAGGGWSKIVNVNSGKLMAVSGASTADGAQITQWPDNGTTDHLWRLI
jgi:hypothetical protein